MFDKIYYRPEWTCGRYSSKHKVAIFYNLIEGISYFFENESAVVISRLLSINRNGSFSLEELSNATMIAEESLYTFLSELMYYGLLVDVKPTQMLIKEYRDKIRERRKDYVKDQVRFLHESSILLNHDDAERKYMEKTGDITSVMFELTYNCSEKCIHCYNPGATRNDEEISKRHERQELSLEDYCKIIDELVSHGLVKVCLTGGDPFSKPHIWEIIDYLWRKQVAVDIFTNGQIGFEHVQRLASYYPRTIGISLYSDIPEVHDKITRKKGSHRKTKKFIEECSIYAIPMFLKCCIMLYNATSYYTVKQVAYNYGAIPQFDLNVTDSLDGDICASTLLRLPRELLEIVLQDEDLPYYVNGNPIKEKKNHLNENACNAGAGNICITPEGYVRPCCAFPMNIGNVKEDSVVNIVQNSKLLEWWKSRTLNDFTECYTYPYCLYCQLCAGNNYNSNGSPLIPSENNCFLAKERYMLAERMSKGYSPLNGKSLEARLAQIKIPNVNLHRIKRIDEVSSNNDLFNLKNK